MICVKVSNAIAMDRQPLVSLVTENLGNAPGYFSEIDASKCSYRRTKSTTVHTLSLCFTLKVGLPLC